MDGDQPHDEPTGAGPAPRRRLLRLRGRVRWREIRPRQVLRAVLVGLAVLLPAAAWGVPTAQTEASLGPHLARYEVTVDHEVTVDLGPLGTLVVDSPLPLPLGARVVVLEIPREVVAVDDVSTLDALGADLRGYVRFFASPQATLDTVVQGLATDAVRRTALGAAVLGLVVWGIRTLLGSQRRAELAGRLGSRRLVAGGLAMGVVVIAGLSADGPAVGPEDDAQTASAVFDGTPLEGARLTGRLAGVIDTYGGQLVEAYRTNEDFYDAVAADARASWEARAVADALTRERRGQAPATGLDPVVLLVVSDLHCNVGMARVIREVAELSEADVVLNAGDTTVNGTAAEEYCVTAFTGAVPAGATMVVSDGNHDSPETSAQEAAAGAVVLDGAVVDVAGVRILGDSDPNTTRIGVGTRRAGEESVSEAGARLAEVACDDGAVDLLLVHTPALGTAALDQGCVPAQVSGHLHRRYGPTRVGTGVRYISASTAGATLGQPTVGTLRGIAELTVLRFDPEQRRVVDQRLVRVQPDGAVSVGQAVPWPAASTRQQWVSPSSAPR